MCRFIYTINFLIILFALMACSDRSDNTFAILPLYASCSDALPAYERKLDRLGYDVSFSKELYTSGPLPANPGLMGVVRMMGDLNQQEIEEIENGYQDSCMPINYVSVEASIIGLQEMLRILQEEDRFEQYLTYDGGNLILYYNDASAGQRAEVLY